MEQQLREVFPGSLSFFNLVTRVGNSGTYQKTSMILWCFLWFIAGNLLLGTPFMFFHNQFQCPNQVPPSQCFEYVCAKCPFMRNLYVTKTYITSIANFRGDDYCQTRLTYETLSSLIFFGCLCGYILLSFLVDNLGRKPSMMLTLIVTIFGMVLTVITNDIPIIGFGLFFTGFGSGTAVTICFYFISETVQDKLRQRYTILVQVCFCLGGLGVVFYYYVWGHWKLIHLYLITIPWIICTVLVYIYVEQVPMFLFKKSTPEQILKSLNRIGKINKKIDNLITIEQIQDIKNKITQNYKQAQIVTPIDLFRHTQIRLITISICFLNFILHILYYGPFILVSSFGLNIFINAVVLNISELVSYSVSYMFIHRMSRRKVGMGLFGGGLFCSSILIFLKHQKDCSTNCLNNYIQLCLIFMFRFFVSVSFSLFAVNCNELFPSQVRGLGIGISSAIGAIASTIVPVIFGQLQNTNFPPNIIFAIGALAGIILNFILPETKGKQLKQFIEELQEKSPKKLRMNLIQQIDLSSTNQNTQDSNDKRNKFASEIKQMSEIVQFTSQKNSNQAKNQSLSE